MKSKATKSKATKSAVFDEPTPHQKFLKKFGLFKQRQRMPEKDLKIVNMLARKNTDGPCHPRQSDRRGNGLSNLCLASHQCAARQLYARDLILVSRHRHHPRRSDRLVHDGLRGRDGGRPGTRSRLRHSSREQDTRRLQHGWRHIRVHGIQTRHPIVAIPKPYAPVPAI